MKRISRKKMVMKKVAIYSLIAAGLGALFLILFMFYLAKDLPSLEEIKNRQISQSTKIFDREGKVLLYEINGGQKRTYVPLNTIPQHLKDATIAIEDQNFYTEGGFSWSGYLRAFVANFLKIFRGGFTQGGSTITQQLAKNAFLSPEQTISRKLRELMLAIQLNRHYSKDRILELYLNEIPYGLTSYGVEAASQNYFSKTVSELTLGESAILAALPQAPSRYSPWGTHRDELFAREKTVLDRMRQQGKITDAELKSALAEKIVFTPLSNGLRAPHFSLTVQDYLVNRYGEATVRTGGLKVITTLNWQLQQLAERVVKDGAASNEKLYSGKNAALVAEDPKTGQLLALVGSRDYFDVKNEGNFNVPMQGKRQPGSALKPFVYMTLMEKGFTGDSVLFDVPTEFKSNDPACPPIPNYKNNDPRCFHPENFSGNFKGPVSLRNALGQSLNIPAVKTLYLAGMRNTLKTLSDFGITTLTDPARFGLTLTLGGGEVRMIELVGAYSVLAQEGIKHDQVQILEVRDHDGNLLESYQDKNTRVVDAQYPRMINDILSDAKARTNLFQDGLELTTFPDYDVALKTGTSNDYRDAWAMGYSPFLVAGVWAGNNNNAPLKRNGGSILAAVPMWHNFMKEALPLFQSEAFTKPDSIQPEKPILRGDYLANKQVHSILYYVDKNDPTGPTPEHPESDSQFINWETGVLNWARNNIADFGSYNLPFSNNTNSPYPSSNEPPRIEVKKPLGGDFVTDSMTFQADLISSRPMTYIAIFFNNTLVKELRDGLGNSYSLNTTLSVSNIQPQNSIRIEVTNDLGVKSQREVIVYK